MPKRSTDKNDGQTLLIEKIPGSIVTKLEQGSTCVSFRFFAVFVLFRETERLWETWIITKTAFPSPRCNMSCTHLVGAARQVMSHQGEEGGLKLAKRSLFTFCAVLRL